MFVCSKIIANLNESIEVLFVSNVLPERKAGIDPVPYHILCFEHSLVFHLAINALSFSKIATAATFPLAAALCSRVSPVESLVSCNG